MLSPPRADSTIHMEAWPEAAHPGNLHPAPDPLPDPNLSIHSLAPDCPSPEPRQSAARETPTLRRSPRAIPASPQPHRATQSPRNFALPAAGCRPLRIHAHNPTRQESKSPIKISKPCVSCSPNSPPVCPTSHSSSCFAFALHLYCEIPHTCTAVGHTPDSSGFHSQPRRPSCTTGLLPNSDSRVLRNSRDSHPTPPT